MGRGRKGKGDGRRGRGREGRKQEERLDLDIFVQGPERFPSYATVYSLLRVAL